MRIEACEAAGWARNRIREVTGPAHSVRSRSPFIHRLQTWPRGHRGAFETLNYLLDGQNHAREGTVEHCCEQFALNCAIAEQHHNKLRAQAQLILNTFERRPKPRILLLACGSCRDLQRIAADLIGHENEGELFLNDTDGNALLAAKEALRLLIDLCRFIPGHPARAIRKLESRGPFDLVTEGGLFDYLPDEQISYFVRNIYQRLLKPGGKLFFTNVGTGNPYRSWMEYLADWVLIERSEDDLFRLCRNAGVEEGLVRCHRDETGLTILAEVTRAAEGAAPSLSRRESAGASRRCS